MNLLKNESGKTYDCTNYQKRSHDSQYGTSPSINAWRSLTHRYFRRGMEKIAENRKIIQYLPYVTRWDYLATMFTEAITVNGPEQLGNIQVPKRASYIRVIMLELSRIASHLLWLGPFMADIGAQTPFFYIFRERELIYDLFEAATERVENVGIIGGEEVKNRGLSGPMLRASGIQWDLRKVDHYECYDEFDWEVQWQKEGDSLARYLIRNW
ncbi:NAD(P)H-quinone oxidoreductase subunit H chloroplastic [Bienertia sinuspersici]